MHIQWNGAFAIESMGSTLLAIIATFFLASSKSSGLSDRSASVSISSTGGTTV